MTMIATAMRAARESGITLPIKCFPPRRKPRHSTLQISNGALPGLQPEPICEASRRPGSDQSPSASGSGQSVDCRQLLQPVFSRKLCQFWSEQLCDRFEECCQFLLRHRDEAGAV